MKTIQGGYLVWLGFLLAITTSAAAAPVTFKVNLEYQITNTFFPTFDTNFDTIEVKGSWDGWSSGLALARVAGTTLYTNTINIAGSPGTLIEYKYHTYGLNDNWDGYLGYVYTNNGNRAFILTGSPQTNGPVYFSDQWGGVVPLTLRVDMGAQVVVGNFVPGIDTVEVRGSWDNFSSGISLTNDPVAANTNLYSMTFPVGSPAPGGLAAYKFHVWGSHDFYETDPNRILQLTNPATVMPAIYFSDLNTNDLLLQDTSVAFSVNMTNALDIYAYAFDPNTDSVYVNGLFVNWNGYIGDWYPWAWLGGVPMTYQLVRKGTTLIYTNTVLVPKGTSVRLVYKYGIDQFSNNFPQDDEAAFKSNRVRYVRTLGNYTMPVDSFGNMSSEISFGNLQIAPPVAGKAMISWLGRPGVHLQVTTNLVSGLWVDHWSTDGLGSTNFPVNVTNRFFRLIKP